MVNNKSMEELHCACLIHGSTYDWTYVDRMNNMLTRHSTRPIRLHVYTEAERAVPSCYIKHSLDDWKIYGPKKAWWYKIQMFNPEHYSGPLLYIDLDTVIVDNIDWIWQQNLECFWSVRDFKCLWRAAHQGINSSVMWWDTSKFDWLWNNFKNQDLNTITKKHHGDQDYITEQIPIKKLRFLPLDRIKSWRWQALDGGYDFKRRTWKMPGTGTNIRNTSILVFHGNPKPHEVKDATIIEHWQ